MSKVRVRVSRVALLAWLSAIIFVSGLSSFLIRFEGRIPNGFRDSAIMLIGLALLTKLPVFMLSGLHRRPSRVGLEDAIRVYVVNAGASILLLGICHLLGFPVPGAVYPIDLLICSLGTGVVLFATRMGRELYRKRNRDGCKNVLIYGAGTAGLLLLREIRNEDSLNLNVVGFLDDDRSLRRAHLRGVRVLGSGRRAAFIVDRFRRSGCDISEVLVAIPSANSLRMQDIYSNCRAAGLPCKVIPSVGELLKERSLSGQLRDVSIADLLGRDPVHLDEQKIRTSIAGQAVLVTGGAGSIGSELCRQIAAFNPSKLVILDQAESDLFRIDLELKQGHRHLKIIPEMGDIRDAARVDELISEHHIQIIFHAAAYKHVPMMESSLLEAVQNNVIGTWNLVDSAVRHNIAHFVMISSDKAVNPTNVMGTTKRISELIVAASARSNTKMVSVRFGNVLGSNGSVVPTLQQQIAQGGPVTVTHPEMQRYFMTIREAVQLVLQAFTMGKDSEIFVLDMGEPVKIMDLARNLIRLSGKVPDEEIEIRITGLRPGEKLYEELIIEGENIIPTYHPKIKIFRGQGVSTELISEWVSRVRRSIQLRSELQLVADMKALVPEWQPSGHWQTESAASPSEELVGAQ